MIDSLYTGYFTRDMPHVLKVLLTCDEKVRIKRALERTHTHKETAEDVRKRDEAHDAKFRKLYADENFLDPNFFDLVIDTTDTKVDEVAQKIIDKFGERN
ncbi:cytidylate kinase family protein [Candidatus Curtissbacteria bacterium]|nr:cytidylate kinase family protein [Candidatus Curtissbacteria bacterium]